MDDGYGIFRIRNGVWRVHRVTLWLAEGPSPKGRPLALHSCDNRTCCNPKHLRWGNTKENSDDKWQRNEALIKGMPTKAVEMVVERERLKHDVRMTDKEILELAE